MGGAFEGGGAGAFAGADGQGAVGVYAGEEGEAGAALDGELEAAEVCGVLSLWGIGVGIELPHVNALFPADDLDMAAVLDAAVGQRGQVVREDEQRRAIGCERAFRFKRGGRVRLFAQNHGDIGIFVASLVGVLVVDAVCRLFERQAIGNAHAGRVQEVVLVPVGLRKIKASKHEKTAFHASGAPRESPGAPEMCLQGSAPAEPLRKNPFQMDSSNGFSRFISFSSGAMRKAVGMLREQSRRKPL